MSSIAYYWDIYEGKLWTCYKCWKNVAFIAYYGYQQWFCYDCEPKLDINTPPEHVFMSDDHIILEFECNSYFTKFSKKCKL